MVLRKRQRYLQIALNSTLEEARKIINQIPLNERILIEAGTPLIKAYGIEGIRAIRTWWEQRIQEASLVSYIVSDIKCADLAQREVRMSVEAGASAVTCLGVAPIETIDIFIEECKKLRVDSMIDMMNVEAPVLVLGKLKKLPDVVILHRGVDEEAFNPEKQIPFNQIQRIKDTYDLMISIAGGDTFREVQRAIFNDADIVVVWKSFYKSTAETAKLAKEFLKEIR